MCLHVTCVRASVYVCVYVRVGGVSVCVRVRHSDTHSPCTLEGRPPDCRDSPSCRNLDIASQCISLYAYSARRGRGWGTEQHSFCTRNAPAVTLSPSAMTTFMSCGRRLYTSLAGSVRGGKGGQLKVTTGQLSVGRQEPVGNDCSSIATNTTHAPRSIFFAFLPIIELRSYDNCAGV